MDKTKIAQGQINKPFDFRKFFFKLLNNWYLFVVFTAIAYLVAYFQGKFVIPEFNVHATILIVDRSSSTENLVGGLPIFGARKNMENEIGILKSSFLSITAIKELDWDIFYYEVGRYVDKELYRNSPFVVNLDTSHYQQTGVPIEITILSAEKYRMVIKAGDNKDVDQVMQFGQKFIHENYGFSIHVVKPEGIIPKSKYMFYINDLNGLSYQYSEKLLIEPRSPSSSILWLWCIGSIPQKEADFLNKVIEVYIRRNLDEKNQIAVNTIKFIDDRIQGIIDSLKSAEIALADFKLGNQISNVSDEGQSLLSKLESLQTQRELTNFRLKYYTYIQNDVHNGISPGALISPSVMGVSDPLLITLLSKLTDLYQEKSNLAITVKSGAYEQTAPLFKLQTLELNIKSTQVAILNTIDKSIEAITQSMSDFDRQISQLNAQIQALPITERQLMNITRKFDLNDNLYTFLLEKRMEAGITQAATESDTKVLDMALARNAKYMGPYTSQNQKKYMILGLIIPIIIIVLRDLLNFKITEIGDIENHTTVPLLGVIGHNLKQSSIPVYDQPKSHIAESFRAVRTNLQYILVDYPKHVVSVCSTVSGEGKTFFAVNLAAIIAISGRKTLLIGLDLRKPKTHHYFDLSNDIGVSTYLISKHTAEQVIRPTYIENLFVATSGPVPPNPAELIESDRMKQFFADAAKQYDYVIIDTPPVAIVTDALLLTGTTDATIYVVRQNYTRKTAIKLVNSLYENKEIKNLSIVMNDLVRNTPDSYDYSYGYTYTSYYGGGYYEDEDLYERKNFIQRLFHKRKKHKKR